MTATSPLVRALLITATCTWVAAASPQAAEPRPGEGRPIILGNSVRASDRSTPTPNYTALANGLYARQVVQTASSKGDYTVQVWALLVGPRVTTGDAKLPGAAVLSVNTGRVDLLVGDRKTRLEPGDTASVPEGASLRLVNADETRPAHLRAVVLSGTR
jgi:hypothetical protein